MFKETFTTVTSRTILFVSLSAAVLIASIMYFLSKGVFHYSRELHAYKSTPQAELNVEVFKPRGEAIASILFFNGGGWWAGSRKQFRWYADQLARDGIIAARADYRVHGRHKTGITDAVADARDAFAWFKSYIEATENAEFPIIVSGGSAGGHLASLIAIDPTLNNGDSQPIAGLILFNPVLDLLTASSEKDFTKGELMLIADLDSDQRLQLSPGRNPAMYQNPTLMLFGTEDPILTDARQSIENANLTNTSTRIRLAPGVDHGFFNRSPWREASLGEMLGFLETIGLPIGKDKADRLQSGKVAYTDLQPL